MFESRKRHHHFHKENQKDTPEGTFVGKADLMLFMAHSALNRLRPRLRPFDWPKSVQIVSRNHTVERCVRLVACCLAVQSHFG